MPHPCDCGPMLYTVAFVLAFFNGALSIGFCVLLILLYIAPGFAHRI